MGEYFPPHEVPPSVDYLDLLELGEISEELKPCEECGAPQGHTAECTKNLEANQARDHEEVFCMDGYVIQLSAQDVAKLVEYGAIAHYRVDETVMDQYFTAIGLSGTNYLASGTKAEIEEILASL